MNSLTVRQRISLNFGLVIAIILVMAVVFYQRADHDRQRAEEAINSDLGGVLAGAVSRQVYTDHMMITQQMLNELRVSGKGMVVMPQATLDKLAATSAAIDKAYTDYLPTITLAEDRRLAGVYRDAVAEYQKMHQQVMALLAAGKLDAARVYAAGTLYPQWAQGRVIINQQIDLNQGLVREALNDWSATARANQLTTLAALAVATVLAALCGLSLHRAIMGPIGKLLAGMAVLGRGDLSRRLDLQRKDEFAQVEQGFNDMADSLRGLVVQAQNAAVQLTTSITEVAASSRQQQATASESAATTTEIGVTTREIAATSRDLVRTIGDVSSRAEQTAHLAGTGQEGIERMAQVMQRLTEASNMLRDKLALLNERASGINQVVTTVVKVADQTNLLSLNAAIEAEKAGEYGRGFAVVATEVRRLADQTAVATYDIEQMVREIQSAVASGVMGMDKFAEDVRVGDNEMTQVSEQLSQIIQQIRDLAPQVQAVNEGIQVQSAGAEQINQALGQLGEVGSQSVEALQQAGFAIDQMSNVADNLRTGVSRFQV